MKSNKYLSIFIYFFSVVEIFLLCYAFYFHYGWMDHAEHLRASMLIWEGKIPYRDFFEHHNPLLWYMLSPIVGLFYKNALILYVSKLISLLAYFGLFFVLYKIFYRYMNMSKKAFVLAILIYFSIPNSYFLIQELHPDSFMLLSYSLGFYYFCKYIEDNKQKYLNISFALFTISFLFLQKILVILFYTAIFALYLIMKNKINIKSIIKASILPILIIIGWVVYFYVTDTLEIYTKFNYELNFIFQKFLGKGRVLGDYSYLLYLPLISLFMLKDFLKNSSIYIYILVFIVILEYITKYIIGAPHYQYFIFSNLISSIIIANYIYNNFNKIKSISLLLIIIITSLCLFYKTPFNKKFPYYYQTNKYVYSLIEKDDYLISTINYINIYGKDASYYWFAGGNIAPIAYYVYGYKTPFLLNKFIYEKQPKIIYNNLYTNQLINVAFANRVKPKEYIENLNKIYDELPVKRETRESFVKRWSLRELSIYNDDLLKFNYVSHPYFPIFIRKDLIQK